MKTDVNQYFRNGKIQNKEGIQSNEILLLNKQNKQNKASDEKDSNKDVNNKIHEIEENIKTNNNLDIKEGEKNNYEIGIDFNSINSIQIQPLINQNEEGLNQDSPEVSPIKRDSDISNYVLKIQDDAAGYKERRNLFGALGFVVLLVGVFDGIQPADAGTHQNADAPGIFLGNGEPRIFESLERGGDTVLHERIHATLLFRLDVSVAIKFLYRSAKAYGEGTAVESSHRTDAAHTCQHIAPSGVDGAADWRDDT